MKLTFTVTVTVPDTSALPQDANVEDELVGMVDSYLDSLEDELRATLDGVSSVRSELQEVS